MVATIFARSAASALLRVTSRGALSAPAYVINSPRTPMRSRPSPPELSTGAVGITVSVRSADEGLQLAATDKRSRPKMRSRFDIAADCTPAAHAARVARCKLAGPHLNTHVMGGKRVKQVGFAGSLRG